MAVGLILDTVLVRPVPTPAVLTLLGRTAGWPGRRIRTSAEPDGQLPAPTLSGAGGVPGGDGDDGHPY